MGESFKRYWYRLSESEKLEEGKKLKALALALLMSIGV